MAANAVPGVGGLARTSSIKMRQKLQPAAASSERMEKPLSPKPEVEERLNRVTCATCSGKGVLDPGVTAFSLPIDDSSITFAPDAVPPTLGSISVASPRFGKAAEGAVDHVRAVGRSHHYHAFLTFKTIHFHQQLV